MTSSTFANSTVVILMLVDQINNQKPATPFNYYGSTLEYYHKVLQY